MFRCYLIFISLLSKLPTAFPYPGKGIYLLVSIITTSTMMTVMMMMLVVSSLGIIDPRTCL